ncbi:uncharacterized protein [Pyrus communis]|uniref:uncharacterized protein n=1 Tax=Pyrus communis TaxID=23211 RepID=UPI0035BF9595
MALYSNNDAWICKVFPSTLDGLVMKWYSELSARSIDCFESLANIFTNTYSMYRDIRKRHKAICRMAPQSRDKGLITYLRHFCVQLAEVEEPDDRLPTMAFKQRLYVYSPLSRS